MRLCSIPLLCCLITLSSTAFAQVGTVRFASGLSSPTYLSAPPDDPARIFVAEQAGEIEILDAATGVANGSPYLSITAGGGLYSFAFHPDYAQNGYVYVYYQLGTGVCRVERYTQMGGDPDRADPASAQLVLELPTNLGHVGGWIGFDFAGLLHVMVGDNGDFALHDAPNNAQSTTGELFGNALRLDVDADDFPGDPDRNYAIPAGNPLVGIAGEDEIWAFGLRNPWRASFDRDTGDLYIADVGQDTREEIDFEPFGFAGGANYGWRLREGTIATPTGSFGGPQPPGGVDPIYEYAHGSGENASITGGYVYRGPVVSLRGNYFFGDFETARIWSIRVDSGTGAVSNFTNWTAAFVPDVGSIDSIVSFGEDAVGNLYLVDYTGEIFRVEGPAVALPVAGLPGLGALAGLLGCFGWMALRGRLPSSARV
jgi:glucose/arabinose dehydrogenase